MEDNNNSLYVKAIAAALKRYLTLFITQDYNVS